MVLYKFTWVITPDGGHQAVLPGGLKLAGSGHEALGPVLLPDHLLHLLPQALLTSIVPAPKLGLCSPSQCNDWQL